MTDNKLYFAICIAACYIAELCLIGIDSIIFASVVGAICLLAGVKYGENKASGYVRVDEPIGTEVEYQG